MQAYLFLDLPSVVMWLFESCLVRLFDEVACSGCSIFLCFKLKNSMNDWLFSLKVLMDLLKNLWSRGIAILTSGLVNAASLEDKFACWNVATSDTPRLWIFYLFRICFHIRCHHFLLMSSPWFDSRIQVKGALFIKCFFFFFWWAHAWKCAR